MDDRRATAPLCQLNCLQFGMFESNYQADDEESCCGSPRQCDFEMDLVGESSQQCCWDNVRPALPANDSTIGSQLHLQHQRVRQDCAGGQSSDGESTQHIGDDFEALEPSTLLDDPCFDTYPGGVEAALADWEAAVSSKAAPAASAALGADASSSSCCNFTPQQFQQQQQQQRATYAWQQLCAPAGCQPAAVNARIAACQQQLLQLQQVEQQWRQKLQQQQQQQQLQQTYGAPSQPATAPADLKLPQLQPFQQQQQQQQGAPAAADSQQQCPFAAFKGDVVGAVLAGLMPAPSCDSNDDWMEPLGVDLMCC